MIRWVNLGGKDDLKLIMLISFLLSDRRTDNQPGEADGNLSSPLWSATGTVLTLSGSRGFTSAALGSFAANSDLSDGSQI